MRKVLHDLPIVLVGASTNDIRPALPTVISLGAILDPPVDMETLIWIFWIEIDSPAPRTIRALHSCDSPLPRAQFLHKWHRGVAQASTFTRSGTSSVIAVKVTDNLAAVGVVHEDRGVAGEHIVRVAYSRPARRVTYGGMSLTWSFIGRNRVGPRQETWLTATVTATRTDTSARRRTSKRPNGSRLDVVDTRSSNGGPKAATDDLRVARAYEAGPSCLKGATRRPATAFRASLDPETTTAPQPPTPSGRHLTATTAPPSRPGTSTTTRTAPRGREGEGDGVAKRRAEATESRAGPNLLYIIKSVRLRRTHAHALKPFRPARTRPRIDASRRTRAAVITKHPIARPPTGFQLDPAHRGRRKFIEEPRSRLVRDGNPDGNPVRQLQPSAHDAHEPSPFGVGATSCYRAETQSTKGAVFAHCGQTIRMNLANSNATDSIIANSS